MTFVTRHRAFDSKTGITTDLLQVWARIPGTSVSVLIAIQPYAGQLELLAAQPKGRP